MVVLFLKPVLEFLNTENPSFVKDVFNEINSQIEQIDINMEGENIFEYFFFKGKE